MVSALYENVPSNIPPDWSSHPVMRLALAETYGTLPPSPTQSVGRAPSSGQLTTHDVFDWQGKGEGVYICHFCALAHIERKDRATTEGARNGFDWLPGQGWGLRPVTAIIDVDHVFLLLSPFYLDKTRSTCCTSGFGFQVFLQLDLHQKAETLMISEDFCCVRKGEFGVWMLLTVEGEDAEFKTSCTSCSSGSTVTRGKEGYQPCLYLILARISGVGGVIMCHVQGSRWMLPTRSPWCEKLKQGLTRAVNSFLGPLCGVSSIIIQISKILHYQNINSNKYGSCEKLVNLCWKMSYETMTQ